MISLHGQTPGSLLRSFSRFAPMIRFGLVGLSGVFVNEFVYVAIVGPLRIWFVIAAIISTQASTTWNFFGSERWAFSGRRFGGAPASYVLR